MLSSLGFDKSLSRSTRNNASKYVLEVPRGFSVHVFKSPSPPAYPQNGTATKQEYTRSRSPSSPGYKPQPGYPARPADAARKPSFGRSGDYFTADAGNDYDRAFDLTRTKSNKPYGIFPGSIPDTYIYERSISSASQDLPGSPASSSSSDTDSIDAPFAVEVSSIRARSGTETLEATLYAANDDSTAPYGAAVYAPISEHPVIPDPSLTSSRYVPRFPISDDDDSTVVSDDQPLARAPYAIAGPTPGTTPAPTRRNSDDRTPITPSLSRRGSDERGRGQLPPALSRRDSVQRSTSPTSYDLDPSVRIPPGLQYVAAPPVGPNVSQRSPTSPVSPSGRRSPRDGAKLTRVTSNVPETPNTKKGVRWTENLVCPSPILPHERRKGWFNRRGDQLWTNDGKYKAADTGQQYPPDLANYPEPEMGWMNEEGVRIDMQHRLMPKPPLRPALKRSGTSSGSGSSGSSQYISIQPPLGN